MLHREPHINRLIQLYTDDSMTTQILRSCRQPIISARLSEVHACVHQDFGERNTLQNATSSCDWPA